MKDVPPPGLTSARLPSWEEELIFQESFAHLLHPRVVGVMRHVNAMEQDHYPETLKACYLINAPAIFSLIWKLVQHMFDPNVRQKARARTGPPRRSRRARTCCH